MSRAATLQHLPDDAQLPAGWVRELLAEEKKQRIEEAVIRQETIAMYEAMTTRHLCES